MYNVEVKRGLERMCGEIMLRHVTFRFDHDKLSCALNSYSLPIFSLYKDNRMLLQHIFFSHNNLFLGRPGAVNEQACICIEWLQHCVPVND